MEDWRKYTHPPEASLRTLLMRMEEGRAAKFGMVLDSEDHLLGVITDGDIRRALVRDKGLDVRLEEIMHTNPVTVRATDSKKAVLAMAHKNNLLHVPIMGEDARVVGLWSASELQAIFSRTYDNPVVIMAGGLGTRLGKITQNIPKPLLPVKGVPILERIIQSFSGQGFGNFYLAVNYLAEHICGYFGDGSIFGVNIKYIHEDKRMGTVGALSKLAGKVNMPCLVMNGDILVTTSWRDILDLHMTAGACATMATSEYSIAVPFGVVERDEAGGVRDILEKPVYSFQVSAGINILSPEALEYIPRDAFFNMPDLIKELVAAEKKVVTHQLEDYWCDIGTVEDYSRANTLDLGGW